MLAEHGMAVSAGKMSGLWSREPASIKLTDLDVICAVLGCGPEELLIPQPEKVRRVDDQNDQPAAASGTSGSTAAGTSKRRDARSLPPL